MARVLIADNDLDSHELVDDLIEMIFRDPKIDRALSRESLLSRLSASGVEYDLVIFNYSMHTQDVSDILEHITSINPVFEKKIVFITSGPTRGDIPEKFPVLVRPFSLDEFSDVVKKISSSAKL